jgi:hypothetical protein
VIFTFGFQQPPFVEKQPFYAAQHNSSSALMDWTVFYGGRQTKKGHTGLMGSWALGALGLMGT